VAGDGVGTGGAPRPTTAAAPTITRAMARRHLADEGIRFKYSYPVVTPREWAHRRGSGMPLGGAVALF